MAAGLLRLGLLKDLHVLLRSLCALGVIWTVLTTMWLGHLGAAYVFLVEPWPLSVRQGPDTGYARAGFERYLAVAPPADVSGITYRDEWGFGGDSIHSLRFRFTERSTIAGIVERLRLGRVPDHERAALRYLGEPGWWPPEERLDGLDEAYRRSGVDFLWVDGETGEAFFQHANF